MNIIDFSPPSLLLDCLVRALRRLVLDPGPIQALNAIGTLSTL